MVGALRNTQQGARHPNILLIVMDATRARNLSCYGYHRPTTPNLDRFAERCVIYERAISPAAWTLPSHASMFTGLYPSRHGAHDEHKYLVHDNPTMAQLLQSHGYHTLAFCHNAYVGPATGLDRGFEYFSDLRHPSWSREEMYRRLGVGLAALFSMRDSAGARYTNSQVESSLRRLVSTKRPFFMFIHYNEPHAPYSPPRRYNRYLPAGVTPKSARQVNQDQWSYLTDSVPMSRQDFGILTALYDAELTYLDTRIAQLWRWLDELEILDRTMVIITSDHGENLGDHQLMGHGHCLYDTLLHVPLIIHYPTGTAQPGRVTHQVQTLDLLPTILTMLGDTSSAAYCSLQGHDLLSSSRHAFTIAEQAHPDLSAAYRKFPQMDTSRYDRALRMIRTERHKYIWASDGHHELYDILNDPAEKKDIVAERADVAETLCRRLAEWRESFTEAIPSQQPPDFDEDVRARLRALGYLE